MICACSPFEGGGASIARSDDQNGGDPKDDGGEVGSGSGSAQTKDGQTSSSQGFNGFDELGAKRRKLSSIEEGIEEG